MAMGFVILMGMAGLGLQFANMRNVRLGDTQSAMQAIGLADRIPLRTGSWVGKDEPLGPNEFIQDAVARNLNYDDYVNRVYSRGGTVFGVYAAYWTPGRMPVQKVASHTPDRCWTENGWKCEEYRLRDDMLVANQAILPAYWRVFRPPGGGAPTYVMYWHVVGGEWVDRGTGFNRLQSPIDWWKDTVHYALKGSAEQYFIRVTSNRPFEEIWHEPEIQNLMNDVASLGLYAPSTANL